MVLPTSGLHSLFRVRGRMKVGTKGVDSRGWTCTVFWASQDQCHEAEGGDDGRLPPKTSKNLLGATTTEEVFRGLFPRVSWDPGTARVVNSVTCQ